MSASCKQETKRWEASYSVFSGYVMCSVSVPFFSAKQLFFGGPINMYYLVLINKKEYAEKIFLPIGNTDLFPSIKLLLIQ